MRAPAGFACPDCGTRLRGGRPGSVVACTGCANPVVVPAPEPVEASRRPAPPEPGRPFDAGRARRRLLTTAVTLLAVVGVAHLGLYLLLTRDARASVAAVEARHGRAALAAAEAPSGSPQPGAPDYRAWSEATALWVDAQAWEDDTRQVSLLRGGILGSFVLQVVITGWILLRLLGGIRRQARGR